MPRNRSLPPHLEIRRSGHYWRRRLPRPLVPGGSAPHRPERSSVFRFAPMSRATATPRRSACASGVTTRLPSFSPRSGRTDTSRRRRRRSPRRSRQPWSRDCSSSCEPELRPATSLATVTGSARSSASTTSSPRAARHARQASISSSSSSVAIWAPCMSRSCRLP
jgi:hypothetical protein